MQHKGCCACEYICYRGTPKYICYRGEHLRVHLLQGNTREYICYRGEHQRVHLLQGNTREFACGVCSYLQRLLVVPQLVMAARQSDEQAGVRRVRLQAAATQQACKPKRGQV